MATVASSVATAEPARDSGRAAPAVLIPAESHPPPELDPPSAAGPPSSEPTPDPQPPGPAIAAEPPRPMPEDSVAVQLAAIEPEAGTPAAAQTLTPMAARTAAMAVPPPRLHPAASYWIEYAVFSRERSAQHLRRALAAIDLETAVVATHAPDGRRLWRVRSAPLDSRVGAEANALAARQKLAIEPLIHRGTPRRAPQIQYWVQFGAFPAIAPATHLQHVLADNGVKTTIRKTRTSSGKSLFLVRSEGFADRNLATIVGELGGSAAKVAFMVGRARPVTRSSPPSATIDRGVGSSLPQHIHRPKPGG